MASQLGEGGLYEGWSLATSEQVYTMWANAFLGLGSATEYPDYYGSGQLYVADGLGEYQSVYSEVVEIIGHNYVYYLIGFVGNN